MASLLNPFGFGQKHAYFYVRLTIHELKNVPLISGEFQVKWRFKHTHPVADVPGLSNAAHSGSSSTPNGAASTSPSFNDAAAPSKHSSKKARKSGTGGGNTPTSSNPPSGRGSQSASVNASSSDLPNAISSMTMTASSAAAAANPTSSTNDTESVSSASQKNSQTGVQAQTVWHQPHPEASGHTELVEISDHSVKWQRRVEVGLKMNVERVSKSAQNHSSDRHHHHHHGHFRGRDGAGSSSATGAGIAAGSSSASIRSLGSASHRDRDRGDDARSLRAGSSSTSLYGDHDSRDDGHRGDIWGKLGRCEVKLTVKQQIDTSSHSSHTMAPPVLGYVVLNLAEFAPHSHPGQASHYHHHHHHHHHHHFHHHMHQDPDPKATLYRSETRRFLLSESRTNASLTISVEMVHIGGSREFIVPTLRDGIIISSSNQDDSDFPILPFVHGKDREDLSPGHGHVLTRDYKDRKENEARADISVETAASARHSSHQNLTSIGGESYRERASSSVSSFDNRSVRSMNMTGTAEYTGLGVQSRSSKALSSAGLNNRPNYPYGFSAPRNVAGHSRIPSQNLKNPQAIKEHKARERALASRKGLGTGDTGTELSPEEIVRDLFRPEPKLVKVKESIKHERGESMEFLQVHAPPPRSGDSSTRTSIDGRSLGAGLAPVLVRQPSASSSSSSRKSNDGAQSERSSLQISHPDDAPVSPISAEPSSASAKKSFKWPKRSDSSSALVNASPTSEFGNLRRANAPRDDKPTHLSGKDKHPGMSPSPSTSTMRSILSAKGIASVLAKRQNSVSSGNSKSKTAKAPAAVITRQSGPQHTPGLLTTQTAATASEAGAETSSVALPSRPTSTQRGPSIRWNLGGPASPASTSPISVENPAGPLDTSSIDVVPASSRVPGSETGPRQPSVLNPPIVVRTSSSTEPQLLSTDSPVSEVPSPDGTEGTPFGVGHEGVAAVVSATLAAQEQKRLEQATASDASLLQSHAEASGSSTSSSPTKKKKKEGNLADVDKSNWRGAGWRADLNVSALNQDVYTRRAWPDLGMGAGQAGWDGKGLPPKARAGSMAIYRINPKVSSPPEEVLKNPITASLAHRSSGGGAKAQQATFRAEPESMTTSESIFFNTPAGLAEHLDPAKVGVQLHEPTDASVSSSDVPTEQSPQMFYVSSASSEDEDEDVSETGSSEDEAEKCYQDARQSVISERSVGV
ncbi:hypothetical protein OC846_002170 [Tilletia horrida]|uniref:C2 NT-type domain-containing protein n=1 Tax=Tilletia horrida TaxID=155126 RepID=A0AAN6JV85_9BASI|nr:hypothetical protein OC846_002170 [Tilletia horrida]KAK0563378.1 hypothetical protein OC861_004827 [Tilletia horrida]